ncbi:nitronate monooxygenase family protein [Mycobacterium avium subsp. avium 2285 (R)]|nr:nitronate monooxygenase family protein [Mycobacterium avium subsp. avium 2285 (R)]
MAIQTAFTDLVGVEHPLVGFNRSPAVVAEVTKAGGFGVLAATAYTPEQLDAQMTWIEEQVGGRPYGIDVLVPGKTAHGDPENLLASLRAQISDEHRQFMERLMEKYNIPPADEKTTGYGDELAAAVNPEGALALLDVALSHPIGLIANALGTRPEPGRTRPREGRGGRRAGGPGEARASSGRRGRGRADRAGHRGGWAHRHHRHHRADPGDRACGRRAAGPRCRRYRFGRPDGGRSGTGRRRRLVRVGVAQQPRGHHPAADQGEVPRRQEHRHHPVTAAHRQTGTAAAHRLPR